jgi:syntaxin 1B/2/3
MTGFTPNRNGDSFSPFYAEVDSIQEAIKQYNSNVSRIADLQTRLLNVLDQNTSRQTQAQLDGLTADTRSLGNTLRERIKKLATWPAKGRDAEIRKNQTTVLKERFTMAVQGYQEVERQHRERQKERVARQFKIVKQDASPEEIAAAVDDAAAGSNQIFAQAVSSSNRFGEARAAQRDVQERHEDLKKIERTLQELTQLFNDMGALVITQEETIIAVGNSAVQVEADTREAHRSLIQAVVHAINARRARWICFFIFLAIAAALAIGLGVHFSSK